jgi:signal transduction histidine kinase
MGGTAVVDSAPGRGTAITVTLPLAAGTRSTP